ncbi:hypothetical protein TrVFT333_001399 [Trichoderma virens FT-333]|nr:hypothetical protein TrVFT333_001399 [Trichoderma virens FT-333]
MDSISSPSQSGLPLETLSIKQLLRLHCREKLLVHPLEWTRLHVEVLQCSFEESPPPPPSQEHLDGVDRIPVLRSPVFAIRKLFAGEVWEHRESLFRNIIGSDGCPLQPYG